MNSAFDFSDYRLFLRQFIDGLPRKGRGEISRMAKALRVNPTLVSQVLMGLKDFTIEQAQELTQYLGLQELEADFFILLVQKERAGTKTLRTYFAKKIEGLKQDSRKLTKRIPQDRVLTDTERAIFYSSHLYSSIWLWTSVGSGKTPDQIANRFSLPRNKAMEILHFLVSVGLCRNNSGVYQMELQRIHLDDDSPFLPRLHANWRVQAIQRSENLEKSELMFTAPISISKKDFAELREEFVQMVQKLSRRVIASEAEDVGCVNIDLFWLK